MKYVIKKGDLYLSLDDGLSPDLCKAQIFSEKLATEFVSEVQGAYESIPLTRFAYTQEAANLRQVQENIAALLAAIES